MAYQFDFLPVLQNSDLLLRGALYTLELTAIGTVFGVSLGIVGAVVRAWIFDLSLRCSGCMSS